MKTQTLYRFPVLFFAWLMTSVTASSQRKIATRLLFANQSHLDTITKLSDMVGESAIFNHSDTYTFVVKSKDDDPNEESDTKERDISDSNVYNGKDRESAKLSIPESETITFATTTELRASLLPDTSMRDKSVGLKSNSERVGAEEKIVSVTKAYLYAISREADNDFHMIVGNKNDRGQPIKLMNCEISALPPNSSSAYVLLKSVRNYLINFLGTDFIQKPGKGYIIFKPGLPTTIKGALFYDIDHKAGAIGPTNYRSPTAWEIHPVTYIEFL